MTRAFHRLRVMFGDDLLIRSGRRYGAHRGVKGCSRNSIACFRGWKDCFGAGLRPVAEPRPVPSHDDGLWSHRASPWFDGSP
jgi:hypothetical protein